MTRWAARLALAVIAGATLGLCISATWRNLPVIGAEAGILCGGALVALRLGPGANAGRHRHRHRAGARHVAPRLWVQARDQARQQAQARRKAGPDDD